MFLDAGAANRVGPRFTLIHAEVERQEVEEVERRQREEVAGLRPAAVVLPLAGVPLAVAAPLAVVAPLAAEDPLWAAEPPSAVDGHSRTAQSSRRTLPRAAMPRRHTA
jgi:hypothetical protein